MMPDVYPFSFDAQGRTRTPATASRPRLATMCTTTMRLGNTTNQAPWFKNLCLHHSLGAFGNDRAPV